MKMVNLVELNLSFNKIVDVMALRRMVFLQKLDLYVNMLTNVDALSKMTRLESLNVGNNYIVDIKPLEQLPIKELNAFNNRQFNFNHSFPVSKKELQLFKKQKKIYESCSQLDEILSKQNKFRTKQAHMKSNLIKYLDTIYKSSKLLVFNVVNFIKMMDTNNQ
ncbi:leucine-rich_repeat domain-containing protein [Hexamita inflata]|uniref:Leucine-rich repeat domain-containing protein n=1 Tax=Hexamita inflata TaxID=28002 RepID=A0AA86QK49_9EUKA|nr:leucine-rich repeat domain-containing protein [Hexamita inflata]